MKVNFYLKDPTGDYETWIYCLISYRNKREKIYTNKKIHPKFWNKKTQRARQSFEGYGIFNQWLKNVDAYVSKIETEWANQNSNKTIIPPIDKDTLKKRLKEYLSKETKEERVANEKNTFWGYYGTFLNRMENGTRVHTSKGTPLAKGTIFQFHNLKNHLKNFESKTGFKITFENIDLVFYKKFVDFLTIKLELGPNSIGKLITNLKVFLREAFEDKLTTNNTFTYRKFKSLNFKSDTVYLNLAEIREIQNLDLSAAPRLERVRDMFIIGCFTGLRYSDLVNIKPKNIENGMIELTQAKTGNVVVIPFTNEVLQILEKYGNTMPKISNQKYNEYLSLVCKNDKCELLKKEITINQIKGGKKITVSGPKNQFISSHTARRSFATNEYAAGDLDTGEIMALTGHQTEKSFYKYIRETPKDKAERIKEKFIQRELKQAAIKNHLKAV
ncbi:MAG: site-specific integrase [Caldilineaceae bacterium]